MTLLNKGAIIKIKSFKHNGKLHRVWEKNLILQQTQEDFITVNDQVIVKEADGSYWRTKEVALSYFSQKHWFNIVALLRADGIKFYCNLASPVKVKDGALSYIDYDLDVEMDENNPRRLLDEDEYQENSKVYGYPPEVMNAIKNELNVLYHWMDEGIGPFQKGFVFKWYQEYRQLNVRWDENY